MKKFDMGEYMAVFFITYIALNLLILLGRILYGKITDYYNMKAYRDYLEATQRVIHYLKMLNRIEMRLHKEKEKKRLEKKFLKAPEKSISKMYEERWNNEEKKEIEKNKATDFKVLISLTS